MATETRSAGTHADDSAVGTLTWSNPGNAAASDNSYSTVSGGPGATSHYHKSTNFGFAAIGDSDILTQLDLRIERKKSSGGTIKDDKLHLVIGGVIQTATNYADTGTAYPSSDTYATYTITTGLPTVAQLKASGFGFVLSCKDSSGFAWGVDLDHTEAIATYTPVVVYAATAAGTAGPATGQASAQFAASISAATASPIAAPASCAASASSSPPVFTATAAPTTAPAQAAATASFDASIGNGIAAPTTAPATCAAAMTYTPPLYTTTAAMTARAATGEAVMKSWKRGDWKYTRLTLHAS